MSKFTPVVLHFSLGTLGIGSFLGLAQWFPPLAGNRVRRVGMSVVNVGGLRMVADEVNDFTVCWAAGWNEEGVVGAQTPHKLENVYLL